MFHKDSASDATFRKQVRSWFEANLPRELRGRTVRPPPADLMVWYKLLSERGWIAPHWPKEHGGMGATLSEQIIIAQELGRLSAPHLPLQGVTHLGPILMRYGTHEQKQRHLPPILRGDVIWAQGYSEPGSGSDLASLTTKAELIDEHFLVNGTKVWQTWAHHADWMFTLVRTDPEAKPKHAGISFLLIDLRTKGVKTKPILNIAGDDEFSQVLLDDVVVTKENLIGPLNGGWKVANDLLANERLFTSSPQHALEVVHRITRLANANGRDGDPVFRDKLAALRIRIIAQEALFWQAAGLIANGRPLGPASSTMKLIATSNLQAATDLLIDVADTHGADVGRQSVGDDDVDITRIFLQSRRATIYGGSSEIQRNVLARRVLGLPS